MDTADVANIPGDDPLFCADDLRRLVETGAATKHDVLTDGTRTGFIVTQVHAGERARELVVLVAFNRGRPSTSEALPAIEAMARAERCTSIRVHTVRPGLVHKLTHKHGFRLSEVILRKNLP